MHACNSSLGMQCRVTMPACKARHACDTQLWGPCFLSYCSAWKWLRSRAPCPPPHPTQLPSSTMESATPRHAKEMVHQDTQQSAILIQDYQSLVCKFHWCKTVLPGNAKSAACHERLTPAAQPRPPLLHQEQFWRPDWTHLMTLSGLRLPSGSKATTCT